MSDFAKPVLALDSALGGCIAAVLHDGQFYTRTVETGRDQAAKLMPMVQEVMGDAGVAFADLGLIITTIGPGSFTGLRIGLSSARTLGLALGIPVQGVSTLAAMARSCAPRGPCVAVLESKRADYYMQAFDAELRPHGEPRCALASEIPTDKIICGDAMPRLRAETGQSFEGAIARTLLDPSALARLGTEIFLAYKGVAVKPEPLYLRGADVSVSNKAQRQITNHPAQ